MSKTEKNLQEAFAGESQANRKYLAFAAQADKEGHPQIAKLFRATAEAETVHAHTHLKAMDGINSTEKNLEEAIAGETHEFESMYPPMIEDAKEEGHKRAERAFTFANQVEKVHAGLYKAAKKALEKGEDMEDKDIHVCSVCGHTVLGDAPDKCPVCKAAKMAFMKIS